MCVFRTDHLELDNQLVYSSLRKTVSSHFKLSLVLYVGLRPIINPHPSPSTLVYLLLSMFSSCWWDSVGVVSDITRRHDLTANFLILWLLQCFFPIFWKGPWDLGVGTCFLDLSIGTGPHNCTLVVIFCNGLRLLQQKFPWWGVNTTLACGYKGKYLECG